MKMGNRKESRDAIRILATYAVPKIPLYLIGSFDSGVTVLSQQIRALNFVWAAIESNKIPASSDSSEQPTTNTKCKVAIIGSGFAGLTVAAGLIKKRANAEITIFEQRDTLLPLQQGSDARWLHPRIYEWPTEGSDASVALLPVLNWTAARASDVVVQILTAWGNLVSETSRAISLYCNTRHLQVEQDSNSEKLRVEWVGEAREPSSGAALANQSASAIGSSEMFDLVVLAVGFGTEKDDAVSYWRNETLGQPSLDRPRATFIVSGQGDGAMIDLLRLRISQFRQDRILHELFHERQTLLDAVKALHLRSDSLGRGKSLFGEFESLATDSALTREFASLRDHLSKRLRRDTDVILHTRERNIGRLFDSGNLRISFQHKLLVYLLYKCGGFMPSCSDEKLLATQHAVLPHRIVRRHGTLRDELLGSVLSESLMNAVQARRGGAKPDPFSQLDKEGWSGGYFGYPGTTKDTVSLDDSVREYWRKEYLPGPTALIATSFCAAVAGVLFAHHPKHERLRVTLHRAIVFGTDELLQQTCDYAGTKDAKGSRSSAGRTFPVRNAVIGLAYRSRRIVRSVLGVSASDLKNAMGSLSLSAASRSMSGRVGFVLAMPILEPEENDRFRGKNPVAGVLYIDSEAPSFFVDDEVLATLTSMATQFIEGISGPDQSAFDRIRNVPQSALGNEVPVSDSLPDTVRSVLELVGSIDPPRVPQPFEFNFDYSDFIPT